MLAPCRFDFIYSYLKLQVALSQFQITTVITGRNVGRKESKDLDLLHSEVPMQFIPRYLIIEHIIHMISICKAYKKILIHLCVINLEIFQSIEQQVIGTQTTCLSIA
jgi:hypothetical protein